MQYFHLKDRSPDSLTRPIVRILYGSLLLLASMLLSGCSEEQITKTTYSIPKPVLDDLDQKVAIRLKAEKDEAAKQAALKTQRILAAFVPDMKNKKFWTAKLVGEPDVSAKVVDDFTSFIKSWSFSDKADELPKWTLPKDWEVQGSNDGPGTVAKAYLEVDGEPLEITISNFTLRGDPIDMAVQNINRWRVQQLSLRPLSEATLEKETRVVELGGEKAYVMNEVAKFTGRMSPPARRPAPKPEATDKSGDAVKPTPPMNEKSSDPKADDAKKEEPKSTESKSENKADSDTKSESKDPAKNASDEKNDKKS